MAKTVSSRVSQRRDDTELRQRARCRDRGPTQTSQVIAIRVDNAFDQAECSQSRELTRECCVVERRHKRLQVGSAYAANVECGTLQRAQQCLFSAGEEVQAFDRALTVALGLGQSCEFALACGGVLQRGQKLEIAAVAAEQNLARESIKL
jgi:hypothetical protein